MLVIISYDVVTTSKGGKKRLRRVAKACEDWGQRVQYSVFECDIDPTQWVQLRARLLNEIDEKQDSLRFYFLGSNWTRKIEHIGAKKAVDFEGLLMI